MSENNELMIVEDVEFPVGYINRDQVMEMADTLMQIHPAAKEVGVVGMRAVAQLALMTGASPLPGTNGIHAWIDNKQKTCIQFGIGFWRGEAEQAGGILWAVKPRPMTAKERDLWGVTANEKASYCMAAMKPAVYELMATMRKMGIAMPLKEAIDQVAVEGVGVCSSEKWANGGGYKDAKNGRPLQWTADERAERDIMRKLVPILQRMREPQATTGGYGWNASDFRQQHYEPKQITAAEDARRNAVFFDADTSRAGEWDGDLFDDNQDGEDEPESTPVTFAKGDTVLVAGNHSESLGEFVQYHLDDMAVVNIGGRELKVYLERVKAGPPVQPELISAEASGAFDSE